MFQLNLNIPGKALLFGEYGLLYKGVGLGCVLPNLNFEVYISITNSTESRVVVESRFFESGKQEFLFSENSTDFYFYKALLPWKQYLENKFLYIKVKKSFSPSLGFGSSASMISAISYALTQYVTGKAPTLNNPHLWKYIRKSLYNIQGISSGYDVGTQLAYIMSSHGSVTWNPKNLFWTFQNTDTEVPNIHTLKIDEKLINQLGCFIKTHIYSDTTQVLKSFSALSEEEKQKYAKRHTEIAESFLKNFSFENLKKCMNKSRKLAQEQGIEIEHPLLKQLEDHEIPFKTMGSGCGDCLWVAADARTLLAQNIVQPEDIAFSFSDFTS